MSAVCSYQVNMAVQKLHIRAEKVSGLLNRTVARVSFEPVPMSERPYCFFLLRRHAVAPDHAALAGYAAVFVEQGADTLLPTGLKTPVVTGYPDLGLFKQDYILAVSPRHGDTRIVYRPESPHNILFATARCNSNCLMCSQPPILTDDSSIVEEHLRIINLVKTPPSMFGISGGEPTLLGDGLVRVIARLKECFAETHVQMLTNGRLYAYGDLVQSLANIGHPSFISAIPLYADVASVHDYIVQARGAFDQTLAGLYNTARYGLQTEVRIVLHKQTIPRLLPLVEFIYRNLPFVSHIALMGLENMGYVKKNWELLWMDPLDYMDTLERATRYLFYRGMHVSIYNLQLCLLPKALWPFARQSISDFKNIYVDECRECGVRGHCAGLFLSSETRHSRGIHSIYLQPSK